MNVLILGLLAGLGAVFYFESGAIGSAIGDEFTNIEDTVSDVTAPLTSAWNRFDDLFHSVGESYGVDWAWLKAFALNESDLGRNSRVARGLDVPSDVAGSTSSDGKSWGLMQVTLSTAKGLDPQATEEKLNDATYSVNLAARYIAQLMKMFSSADPRYAEWVVKSYNQGPGNTRHEIDGTSAGFAQAYWDRWQRNLNRIEENPT